MGTLHLSVKSESGITTSVTVEAASAFEATALIIAHVDYMSSAGFPGIGFNYVMDLQKAWENAKRIDRDSITATVHRYSLGFCYEDTYTFTA